MTDAAKTVQSGLLRHKEIFLIYSRPALSSGKALRLTARSLRQCCRQWYSHAIDCVPRRENMDLCLQVTLMHGSAAGTAMPKQPKKVT